jgi:hypothetical protein
MKPKLPRSYAIAVRFAYEQGWSDAMGRKFPNSAQGFKHSPAARYVSPKRKRSKKRAR